MMKVVDKGMPTPLPTRRPGGRVSVVVDVRQTLNLPVEVFEEKIVDWGGTLLHPIESDDDIIAAVAQAARNPRYGGEVDAPSLLYDIAENVADQPAEVVEARVEFQPEAEA